MYRILPILLLALSAGAVKQGSVKPEYTDNWIVSVDKNGPHSIGVDDLSTVVTGIGKQVHKKFSNAVVTNGLSVQQVEKLKSTPGVRVERDQIVRASIVQNGPQNWGSDRIDQRKLPLNGKYVYGDAGGVGVNVYVLDTGVRTTHGEFGGRATFLKNTVGDGIDNDCNGHGTHVSSTIAGTNVGIAKKATVLAVKVLGCDGSGTWSGVMEGIQYVIDRHKASTNKKTVINMSLGGGKIQAVNDLIASATSSGILVVVAAGNDAADACNSSPASAPSALTVAASDNADAEPYFSNYGPCVDIYAPGVSVYGAWHTSNTAFATLSGTSMASPHVAGVAALYWSTASYTPASLASKITSLATKNVITNVTPGTVNRLLYQDTFLVCSYKIGSQDTKTQYCIVAAGTRDSTATKCASMGATLADVGTASEFLHLGKYVKTPAWIKSYNGETYGGACLVQHPSGAIVANGDCTTAKQGVCEYV